MESFLYAATVLDSHLLFEIGKTHMHLEIYSASVEGPFNTDPSVLKLHQAKLTQFLIVVAKQTPSSTIISSNIC